MRLQLPRVAYHLTASLYRDLAIGGLAGLMAGVVFWWALQGQGMTSTVPGLLGLDLAGASLALHLLASISLGIVFAAISRWQSLNFATTLSVIGGKFQAGQESTSFRWTS